jgi:hypothetical protein
MFDITLRANDHFSLLKSSSAYAGDDGLEECETPGPNPVSDRPLVLRRISVTAG